MSDAEYKSVDYWKNRIDGECELDLNCYNIRSEECIALSQALRHNTSLKTVNLTCNNIGDEGCKYLSQALQVNTSLEELDVCWNNIGHEGCKYLSQALQINTSLHKLYFWFGNKTLCEYSGVIRDQLQRNKRIRERARVMSTLFPLPLHKSKAIIHGPDFEQHYLFDLNAMKIVFPYFN